MGDHVDEQDRMLPIANVGRIMKLILPSSAKISKDAKQTMQECSTEFISFVTSEASDKCHKENRKTINGDDICWALSALGFDNFAEVMLRYMYKYREAERDKANHVRKGNNTPCPDHSISIIVLEDKDGHQSSHHLYSKTTSSKPVGEEKSGDISESPDQWSLNP